MEYKINNSKVKMCMGDLCASKSEVIVSSDDFMMSQGGGVSMAIARSGGAGIGTDVRKLTPAELGDVVVTSAGKLRQKYVFHAITIAPNSSATKDAELSAFIIQNSVKRCFRLMADLKLRSIAFPVIGSGAAGIPFRTAVMNMAEVFVSELSKTSRQLNVEVWLHGVSEGEIKQVTQEVAEWIKAGRVSTSALSRSVGAVVSAGVAATALLSPVGMVTTSLLAVGAKWLWDKNRKRGKRADGAANSSLNCSDSGKDMEHEVFVSYSRKDSAVAQGLCKVLDSIGVPYWIDTKSISAGEDYKRKIVRAIRQATFFIFLSSVNSNVSPNVLKEMQLAVKEQKRIVPIKLDNSPYDDAIEYDISSLDFIDFSSGPEAAAQKLRNTILSGRFAK
jgi:O-acetyl-ADP-ribose deacetylase (regulator of RNase III)